MAAAGITRRTTVPCRRHVIGLGDRRKPVVKEFLIIVNAGDVKKGPVASGRQAELRCVASLWATLRPADDVNSYFRLRPETPVGAAH
jgi:hypothetical protein